MSTEADFTAKDPYQDLEKIPCVWWNLDDDTVEMDEPKIDENDPYCADYEMLVSHAWFMKEINEARDVIKTQAELISCLMEKAVKET